MFKGINIFRIDKTTYLDFSGERQATKTTTIIERGMLEEVMFWAKIKFSMINKIKIVNKLKYS